MYKDTTKRTSAKKDGVGGTERVSKNPIKTNVEKRGLRVSSPRENASMREE